MENNLFAIELAGQTLYIYAGSAHRDHRYLWGSDRHCHGEYELHILLSGHARMEVGKEIHALSAQTGLLIAPGQYHRPLADGPLERFSLRLNVPEGAFWESLRQKVPVSQGFFLSEDMCRMCRAFFYEAEAANPYRREVQQALLTQLVIGALRNLGAEQSQVPGRETVSSMERMAFIDDFFEKNFAVSGGKEELARLLFLSQRQLARLLQKDYGMGYQEKLVGARMDYAAMLLRTTDQPVFRIAEQVGYKSESAFYKAFSRQYHMTPLKYRKENKGIKEEQP